MKREEIRIAIAFPIAEGQRDLLRQILAPDVRLPALYANGETRPCVVCKMELNVGPCTLADGAPIHCPICAMHAAKIAGHELRVLNLGNPDSRPEKQT